MRPCEIVKLVEYIKEQTGHTGDIFININDNAIPIEWIKKWCNKDRKSLEERLLIRYGVITMLDDWEKENEKDI